MTVEDGVASKDSSKNGPALLEVRNLVKHFPISQGIIFQKQIGAVKAVDDISFDVKSGETLGIVGETGCGKSTTAKLLVRLLAPTSGQILFDGQDVAAAKKDELKELHRQVQMVFQDPYSSLNPRKTVGSIIAEPFVIHGLLKESGARRKRVQDLMDRVGLNPEHYNRYPHEFSGGQRQRIGVARAIALEPKLLVADEPVSALDVSIQAQVLNLLRSLQKDFNLTFVFISHDLSVIRQIADRIAVMYLGHVVELGDSEAIYEHPKHPYTAALLSAVPRPTTAGQAERERIVLSGDVPSPIAPPAACVFHPRCPRFHAGQCDVETPLLRELGPHQEAACHYPLERWPMTDAEIRQAEGATRVDEPHLEGAAHEL